MDIVLDIASSIEFWRKSYPLTRAPKNPLSQFSLERVCPNENAWALVPESALQYLAYYGKLHVLVPSASDKRSTEKHQAHVWSGPVPEGSFYELLPGAFVESPEFMFLQAALILDFEMLIAFGDELCGLYSFDDREKRGFRKRKVPLTSSERLSHFISQAAECRGARKARRALKYVVDYSASPMETFDEMTMCLPCRYGGYGLPTATMNQEVTLTARAARIARRDKCYLDMGYLESDLDVEHHGKYDHSSDEEKDSDRARVNSLKDMGIEVIELTKDQVGDLFAYEFIIERIARLLHTRIRAYCKGATPERLRLRKLLFEWNAASGRIR